MNKYEEFIKWLKLQMKNPDFVRKYFPTSSMVFAVMRGGKKVGSYEVGLADVIEECARIERNLISGSGADSPSGKLEFMRGG